MTMILPEHTAPAAGPWPHIPSQRTGGVPSWDARHEGHYNAGQAMGAADAWSRLCCPGSYTSHAQDRHAGMTDSHFEAYRRGYEWALAEATADYEAQGGYAGVMAEFDRWMESQDAEPEIEDATAAATALVAQPVTCPSWCDQGDNHYGDHYHWGTLGTATVDSVLKGKQLTFTVTAGGLPGEEPIILVSSDGLDGFQGGRDQMEALGYLLLDAADEVRDDGAVALDNVQGNPFEPEHVARLSEGPAAAERLAEVLSPIVGHPVEVATGDDDQDVALLLYPADVRTLLALAGIQA